jgi:Glyoxalase/Bleomycin resistance protein/Dioxygenase superfamily.
MAALGYVEHAAVRVKDLQWHVDFFEQVFSMAVWKKSQPGDKLTQIWLSGGVQLVYAPDFKGAADGQLAHLGLMVNDMEKVLEKAYALGAKELPQGKNWFALPEGIAIEVIEAKAGKVEQVLAINPRG